MRTTKRKKKKRKKEKREEEKKKRLEKKKEREKRSRLNPSSCQLFTSVFTSVYKTTKQNTVSFSRTPFSTRYRHDYIFVQIWSSIDVCLIEREEKKREREREQGSGKRESGKKKKRIEMRTKRKKKKVIKSSKKKFLFHLCQCSSTCSSQRVVHSLMISYQALPLDHHDDQQRL